MPSTAICTAIRPKPSMLCPGIAKSRTEPSTATMVWSGAMSNAASMMFR